METQDGEFGRMEIKEISVLPFFFFLFLYLEGITVYSFFSFLFSGGFLHLLHKWLGVSGFQELRNGWGRRKGLQQG